MYLSVPRMCLRVYNLSPSALHYSLIPSSVLVSFSSHPFPRGLLPPSLPSHHITSSCSLYCPLSIFLHSLLHEPRATVNTLPPKEEQWWKPQWRRGMPGAQLPLFFFLCSHTCAAAYHLFTMQTLLSEYLSRALFMAVFVSTSFADWCWIMQSDL